MLSWAYYQYVYITTFMSFTTYATNHFERQRGQIIQNIYIQNANGIMIAVTTSFTIYKFIYEWTIVSVK